MEDIHAPGSTVNGIQGTPCPRPHSHLAWAEQGIVGRGVLIDYYSWAQVHEPCDPFTTYAITLPNLLRCISSQNLTFRSGDILFVRSGFISTYSKLDIPAQESITGAEQPCFAGLAQSEELLKWIWDNQFAAIAGDAPAFESWRRSRCAGGANGSE
jgi:Putative cyclase